MNTYLHSFLNYFEQVIHPAAGKDEMQKNKRRNSKTLPQIITSPDSLNMRASLRKHDNVRRNPAP